MNLRLSVTVLCAFLISSCGSGWPAIKPAQIQATTVTNAGASTSPSHVFTFTAANTLELDRPEEIVTVNIELPQDMVNASSMQEMSVFRVNGGEVVSDYDERSLELWQAGNSVRKVSIVFQDDFKALEARNYEIHLGVPSKVDAADFVVEELENKGRGDLIHINNGKHDFYIGHEIDPLDKDYNAQLPRDMYIRMESEQGWSKAMPLMHLYYNTPEFREEWKSGKCEPMFVISPGFPTEVDVAPHHNFVTVTMSYQGWTQQACPPDWIFEEPKPTSIFAARAVVTIYRNLPRAYASTSLTINESFYNHSGFGLGGVETELERPLVIFGNEQHTLLRGALWANTEEKTDLPEFMQIQADGYIFRRGGNRDGWAPFTTIAESRNFYDYYVVQGKEDRAILGYFPEFQQLANRKTRDVGEELNMIGAGYSVPLMPPNPILFSQTHLGSLEDLWEEVRPGTYSYTLTTLFELPFGPEHVEYYDQLAKGLASPITLNLIPDDATP